MGDETLAQVGEFTVIDRLTAGRGQPRQVALGPGDDAALVLIEGGRTAVSTDMLIENRHFRFDWSRPFDVGRKAIAQNAADIEAMGARVSAFVVALGAPTGTQARLLIELVDGLWDEADRLGAGIVGGDLVAAPQWVVSVTVLGDLDGRDPVTRGGARPGSVVAVVGELGRSAAGYALWRNEIDSFPELRARHLVPAPPYGQGVVAADAGAQAMTDVSDGLLADLAHIGQASAVCVDLFADALADDRAAVAEAAAVTDADPLAWVLGGGEDHALVAVFPTTVPPGWRVIGRTSEGPAQVMVDGRAWEGETGWQSFG
ncbi:MAG: thiamine-phosphate kinase [Mycobacterium sp.]